MHSFLRQCGNYLQLKYFS